MTDTLIRVSLSGTSDFHPLALAPGLPMLDGKKLTYQVLLGWFGNLLAEPFLDDDGVLFRIQHAGRPIKIVERTIATDADLDGPLAADFDRLKKALFDVRPVSPSERLIFNRLNPPIANHDGMLYRVKTEQGVDRLVWCWGFQRRVADGKAKVCLNPECSALFIHRVGNHEVCPRCGASFAKVVPKVRKRQRRKPFGAIAATIALTALGLGTYWYAANLEDEEDGEESLLGQLGPDAVQADEKQPGQRPLIPPTPDTVPEVAPPVTSEDGTPPLKRNDTTKLPMPDPTADEEPVSSRPRPLFEPDMPDLRAPLIGKTPDLPRLDEAPEPGVKPIPKPTDASIENSIKPTEIKPPQLKPVEEPKANTSPLLPEFDDEPKPESVKPEPKEPAPLAPEPKPATETKPPLVLPEPTLNKPNEPNSPAAEPSPQTGSKRAGGLKWHDDYLAAYQQAMDQERPLLMVFRDSLEQDATDASKSGFAASELESPLENYVRVTMSIGSTVPGLTPAEAPTRLMEHRSFRHLNGRPGIAIIDLTDPKGPYYGRVVTALPLPESGKFGADILNRVLVLPPGSIGQRTLILTVRVSLPDGSVAVGDPHPQLMQLTSRSVRLMAQNEQPGPFDQGSRAAEVVKTFGNSARMREMVFATAGQTTIQDAAIQAVRQWIQNADDLAVLNQPATAYGLDLYQSPSSQRWYASCIIVNRPN